MIDTVALKSKILALAFQGKLSERTNDDAQELFAHVCDERDLLIKQKVIKKNKTQLIENDDLPFIIPSNWIWVRLGDVINLQSGQDLTTADYNDKAAGIPYITGASNFRADGSLIINRWTETPKAIALKDDILLSVKGTVGKLAFLQEEKVHIARQIMGIRPIGVNLKYVNYFVQEQVEELKALSKGLIPGIERDNVLNMLMPMPPLCEQKSIVEKIEEAFSQLDVIDLLQQQYSSDLEVLKSKIIDAGIQGKLTEQLPEDGTAEELLGQIAEERKQLIKDKKMKKERDLPVIDNEDIDIDIPHNWEWVRLGDISQIFGGKRIPAGRSLTTEDTGHKYIRVSEMKNGTIITDNLMYVPEDIYSSISRYIINKEDVYITVAGTIGRVGIIPDEIDGANLTENADRLVFKYLNKDWLVACLSSSYVQKQIAMVTTQVAQPKLAIKRIEELIIPLPPLAEQERIADGINKTLKRI